MMLKRKGNNSAFACKNQCPAPDFIYSSKKSTASNFKTDDDEDDTLKATTQLNSTMATGHGNLSATQNKIN